jgi:hypothetical protein
MNADEIPKCSSKARTDVSSFVIVVNIVARASSIDELVQRFLRCSNEGTQTQFMAMRIIFFSSHS